jgi:hypothetical protein
MRSRIPLTVSNDVAAELWFMAQEYKARAAEDGNIPDIGEPPDSATR